MPIPLAQRIFRVGALIDNVARQLFPSYKTISLSSYGVISDAVLDLWSTTYGTDQTALIQSILDLALTIPGLRIIWDVRVSCTGLKIWSGTQIIALPTCGAILRPNSNKPLFSNGQPYLRPSGSRTRPTLRSEYTGTPPAGVTIDGYDLIDLQGGIWNCNGWNLDPTTGYYPANTAPSGFGLTWTGTNQQHHTSQEGWIHGFRFCGFRGTWKSVTILNSRTFGVYVADYDNFTTDGLTIIQQRQQRPEITGNTDGLHHGRGTRANHHNYRCAWSGDDGFAVVNAYGIDQIFSQSDSSAAEMFPYAGPGTVTEVTCNNLLLDNCTSGIRVLSGQAGSSAGGPRIENLRLKGVIGTVIGPWLAFCQYGVGQGTGGSTIVGPGNVGIVDIQNVKFNNQPGTGLLGQNFDSLKISDMEWNTEVPLLTATTNDAAGMTSGLLSLDNIRSFRTTDNASPLIDLQTGTIDIVRANCIDTKKIVSLLKLSGPAAAKRFMCNSVSMVSATARKLLLHSSSAEVIRMTDRGCEYDTAYSITGAGSITTYSAEGTAAPADVTAIVPSAVTSATLQGWYEYDDVASVRTGTGGASQATTGNTVTQWRDKSSFARHLDINGSTSPPILGAGIVFSPTITPATVLEKTYSSVLSTPVTMFIVAKYDVIATTALLAGVDATNNLAFYIDTDGGGSYTYRNYTPAGGGFSVVGGVVDTSLHLHVSTFAGTGNTSWLRQDGVQTGTSASIPNCSAGGLRIGGSEDRGIPIAGKVLSVLIYIGSISQSEVKGVEKYLATKYSTPALPF